MRRKYVLAISAVLAVFFVAVGIAIGLGAFERKYSDADFGIETFVGEKDKDMDGVDDQTDILMSARDYLATSPKYKSKYYAGGYPDDEYGVCTDVVAFVLRGAGYDLRTLVDADIHEHSEQYNIEVSDDNIDFRRVDNLKTFFDNNAEILTTDVHEVAEWQGGDIVVFQGHIGIVSDVRNRRGVALVLHHESLVAVELRRGYFGKA